MANSGADALALVTSHCSDATRQALDNAPREQSRLDPVLQENTPTTAYFITPDNRRVLLHSKRRPVEEAERHVTTWAEENNVSWDGLIVVLGIGCGYHLTELSKQMGKDGLLLILDLDPSSAKHALSFIDLSFLQDCAAPYFFVINQAIEQLRWEFKFWIQRRTSFRFAIFSHPGTMRAAGTTYDNLLDGLLADAHCENTSLKTEAHKSAQWIHNTLTNLPTHLTVPPIDVLFRHFPEKPAIVVAAGPSLDAAIPYLEQVKEYAVIIAVGTATKPLLAHDIIPDFSVSLDASQSTYEQYANLETNDISLVTAQIGCPDIVQLFGDRQFVFSCHAVRSFNHWLKQIDSRPSELTVGGTVTVSAIDFAGFLGCDPVITLGLDLCFREDGQTHAQSSAYDGQKLLKDKQENVRDNHKNIKLWEIPGNYRKKVLTCKQFALYVDMLASYLSKCKRYNIDKTFYNANTDGARIENMQLVRPDQLPELLPTTTPLRVKEHVSRILVDWHPQEPTALREAWEAAEAELQELDKKLESAMDACDQLLKTENMHGTKYKELSAILDETDEHLQSEKTPTWLIDDALRIITIGIMNDPMNEVASETERFKKVIAKSRRVYEQALKASKWVQEKLPKALKAVKDTQPSATSPE